MASTINADTGVVTGITGIVQTADNTGNLTLQANGVSVLTVNKSNVVAVTGIVSSTGNVIGGNILTSGLISSTGTINVPNTFGFKNRIINGGMTIDQRNAGAAITVGGYNVDRWRLDTTSFGQAYSIQQNKNSVTPPAGFTNYLGIQMTTGVTPTGTQLMTFDQVIEGYNIADLAWGTASAKAVTVSAWVYSSLTGTFSGSLVTNSYSCVFTYSIPVANTWTYVTATIPGLTAVAPTSTTNGAGVLVYFTFGASGSYVTSTTGSWQSGLYYAATGATNVCATTNATFFITGVQLEVGSQATSFDFRDYGRELIMCQRYCFFPPSAATYVGGMNGASSGLVTIVFPVVMRTAPSGTVSGTWSFDNYVGVGTGTCSLLNSTSTAVRLLSGALSGLSGGAQSQAFEISPGNTGTIIFSAEL